MQSFFFMCWPSEPLFDNLLIHSSLWFGQVPKNRYSAGPIDWGLGSMGRQLDDFNRIVESLYGCVEEPIRWAATGQLFADLTGSAACEVSTFCPHHYIYQSLSLPLLDEKNMRLYLDEMVEENPRLSYAQQNRGLGSVYSDSFAFEKHDFERAAFVDWTSEFGFRYCAGSNFEIDEGTSFAFLVHRAPEEGFIDEDGLQLIERIAPHVRRSAYLSQQLTHFKPRQSLDEMLAEHAPYGMIVTKSDGTVLEMNQKAQSQMSVMGTVSIERYRYLDLNNAARGQFIGDLKRLFENDLLAADQVASGILHDIGGKPSVRCIARKIEERSVAHPFLNAAPSIVLYLFDLGIKPPTDDVTSFQTGLGLSKREAQISWHILRGERPKVIALDLGISEHTVREFIRRIHTKVGVKGQAQLVRLLAEVQAVSHP